MKSTQQKALFIMALSLLSMNSFANTSQSTTEVDVDSFSNRSIKKLGAYAGILGDPHPTIFGVNVAYNALDFMRASIGMGKVTVSTLAVNNSGISSQETSLTTLGAGARFFVPGWNVSPTAGLGYSHVFISSDAAGLADDYKANNIYGNLGIDWQARGGFNLGGGMNISLNGAAPTAPYINIGYFFM